MSKLSDIAEYVKDSIKSSDIDLFQYITTDCLLQNKEGRTIAQNLPPTGCTLTRFVPGDILIANIRPYLKKIWKADIEGGASSDVLVFRAKESHCATFLFALLLQDAFYDYVMKGTKGSKMPRGDKQHIMNFPIHKFDVFVEKEIGGIIDSITTKINLNKKINVELEQMAKQLYDYWFVQFDFPDENGRPYKSSGGKMVWNEQLKREIPEGWEVKPLAVATDLLYGYPFNTQLFTSDVKGKPIIRIRDILDNSISAYTSENVDEKYKLAEGDVVVGMDGNFHMNFWCNNLTYINQRCFRVRPLMNSVLSSVYIYHYIKPYIKRAEQRAAGSTVGHLLDSDIQQVYIPIPNRPIGKDTMDNLLRQIVLNRQQNISLQSLRNQLLPLLMSGQVTIK